MKNIGKVNPEKFLANIFNKTKRNMTNDTIKFDIKTIEAASSVRLLGVQLDGKLNFSFHVGDICKCSANQLSALVKLNNLFMF